MSRINTNVPSLIAQRTLGRNNDKLNVSLERLSTGLKINRGSDDPSGLIASENLRADKVGIEAGIKNAERASNIIGTAEGGLSEISSLLNEVQSLVSEAANSGGLSSDEISANQLQVDSILNTINRLASSTSFQGQKLLDGSLDYTTGTIAASSISNLRINGARLADGADKTVTVEVVASADVARVGRTATTNLGGSVTLEIGGVGGTEQLSFLSGATNSGIAASVNAVKDSTGVSAVLSGGALRFNSTEYGSSQFVSVKAISGEANFTVTAAKDTGVDASVTVNGAAAETDGLAVKLKTSTLDLEFDLHTALNVAASSTSFSITGGGASFSIGSKVNEQSKAGIGIAAVTTGNLGTSTLGFLSTLASGKTNDLNSGNLTTAQKILDKSIVQVSQLRGRLGAFQKFELGSTVNALGVALENTSAAESAIRDTDFAEETSSLTRSQILSQAASSILSQANSAPQAALSLLR
jgi:flagellin